MLVLTQLTQLTLLTLLTLLAALGPALRAGRPQVFPTSRLALLSLGALAIALAGALLPATWAARTRTATALRTE
jgi:putative ABC transport system permease protein